MIAFCLLGALLGIVLSGFYSGSETGLYCLNRLRLRVDAERGDSRARRLAAYVRDDQTALSTLLIGTNVSNYVVTVLVASWLARQWGASGAATEIYTTAIVTPIIFVFGEVIPKILYQRSADRLMRSGALALHVSAWILWLPAKALKTISTPLVNWVDPGGRSKATDPRRHMALLLQDALVAEGADDRHTAFVDRVLGLSATPIHQIMAPRNRVVSLRGSADRREFVALARKHPHSRFLLHEKDPRRVSGYVNVLDLLADDSWQRARDKVRPVVAIAAHASVASTVIQLQRDHENLAIVVDRNSQLLGLVTLKDLLEEITGELHEW